MRNEQEIRGQIEDRRDRHRARAHRRAPLGLEQMKQRVRHEGGGKRPDEDRERGCPRSVGRPEHHREHLLRLEGDEHGDADRAYHL